MSARRVIRREEVEDSFRPLVPLLRPVIDDARQATRVELIQTAVPAIKRVSHLRRLAGSARWMLIADALVGADWPAGFGVESDDADHNQGKYAFRFPFGIFTVRREPHRDDEQRQYLQERLADMRDPSLGDGIEHALDLTAYLSVAHAGSAKLLVTHGDLKTPMTILLDELDLPAGSPQRHPRANGPRKRRVRSARRSKESLPRGGGSRGSS